MAAALRALTAERNGLQSDLSAKCAALAAAEQLTANARVELEQHCKEAAAHREAAEKVPDSLLCVVCMLEYLSLDMAATCLCERSPGFMMCFLVCSFLVCKLRTGVQSLVSPGRGKCKCLSLEMADRRVRFEGMRAWDLEVNAKAMLLICKQAAAEETLRAERAERNLGEMNALQAKWEQELAQKDRTNAEQVHRLSYPRTTRMAPHSAHKPPYLQACLQSCLCAIVLNPTEPSR